MCPQSCSPPTAELLIGVAGAALLVVSAERVTKGEVRRAARALERLSPPVVGVVLNRVRVYDGGGTMPRCSGSMKPGRERQGEDFWSVITGLKAMQIPLLYALHSGNLYGTERMALATAAELTDSLHTDAVRPTRPSPGRGGEPWTGSRPFTNPREFALQLRPFLAAHRHLAFIATGVVHSLVWCLWNAWYRRRAVHLHIVHGGTDERDSYGRKKLLNHLDVTFVAVSGFVKERLIAHGVRADRIVGHRKLPPRRLVSKAPNAGLLSPVACGSVLIVSRLDPIKRVDLVLDALEPFAPPGNAVGPHSRHWVGLRHASGARREPPSERDHRRIQHQCGGGIGVGRLAACIPARLSRLAWPSWRPWLQGCRVLVADTGGGGLVVEKVCQAFTSAPTMPSALARRLTDLVRCLPCTAQCCGGGGAAGPCDAVFRHGTPCRLPASAGWRAAVSDVPERPGCFGGGDRQE